MTEIKDQKMIAAISAVRAAFVGKNHKQITDFRSAVDDLFDTVEKEAADADLMRLKKEIETQFASQYDAATLAKLGIGRKPRAASGAGYLHPNGSVYERGRPPQWFTNGSDSDKEEWKAAYVKRAEKLAAKAQQQQAPAGQGGKGHKQHAAAH